MFWKSRPKFASMECCFVGFKGAMLAYTIHFNVIIHLISY